MEVDEGQTPRLNFHSPNIKIYRNIIKSYQNKRMCQWHNKFPTSKKELWSIPFTLIKLLKLEYIKQNQEGLF